MHTITIDPSIGKLTAPQLELASADLRNAGLVVKHAGRFVGAMVDRDKGAVCALGAIELATYKKLSYLDSPVRNFISVTTKLLVDSSRYRCDNAVVAFADFVPSALCPLCNDELIERHAASCPTRVCSSRDAHDKVTHYNDAHCVSDDLLVNMLGCAADRAMDLAAERRSLLAGRLSVGV